MSKIRIRGISKKILISTSVSDDGGGGGGWGWLSFLKSAQSVVDLEVYRRIKNQFHNSHRIINNNWKNKQLDREIHALNIAFHKLYWTEAEFMNVQFC